MSLCQRGAASKRPVRAKFLRKGHRFHSSGRLKQYLCAQVDCITGGFHEPCRICDWPADEHDEHAELLEEVHPQPQEAAMRQYVRFYKDGDTMAVETNHEKPEGFLAACGEALASLIESETYKHDWEFQLGFWLPQIVEIASKLKGYKADVDVQQIVVAGNILPEISRLVIEYPEMKRQELGPLPKE
jgi:hypothetical protein